MSKYFAVSRRLSAWMAAAIMSVSGSLAGAEESLKSYSIPQQALSKALLEFSRQSGFNVVVEPALVAAKTAPAVQGEMSTTVVLARLLEGSGLTAQLSAANTVVVQQGEEGGQASTDTKAQEVSNQRAETGREEDQEEGVKLEEIVVTGTHIRGSRSASPLVTINREEIERRGFSTTQQVLESLPQSFGGAARPQALFGGVPGDDNSANLAYSSTVSLRGIGSGSTLVLVNGHRFTTIGQGSFFDLGIIPLSAVERIEVLTDGASATYGSDAVAGVVNVILKKDFNGAETRVEAGEVTDGDQTLFHLSQNLGTQWSGGGGLLALDYFDQSALSTASKSFIRERIPDLEFAAFAVLEPEQKQKRAYVSAHQDFSDRLRGTMDLLYSDKSGSNLYFIGLPYISETRIEAVGAEAGLDFAFGNVWQARFNSGYTRADVASRFRLLDPPESDQDLVSSTWHADGVMEGVLFAVPAGTAKIAAGVSFREERYTLSDLFSGNDFPAKRSVSGVFAEMNVQLASSLVFTVSERFEDYSDFGSTTDPKLGIAWQPSPALRLRTTWGTSFRAPTLDQQSRGLNRYEVSIQDVPNPFSPSGSSIVGGILGSVDLGPETSKNWTAGVDFTPPDSSFEASLTYFRIDYTDRIARPAPQHQILLADPIAYAPFIVHSPSQQDIRNLLAGAASVSNVSGQPESAITEFTDLRFRNLSTVDVDGFDLSVSHGWQLAGGRATLGLESQYLLRYEQRLIPTLPQISIVDTVYNPTRFRGSASGTWIRGGFSLNTTYNYLDSYINNAVVPSESISSYGTTDMHIAYAFGETNRADWLGGLEISLTGFNIFDRDPPFVNVFQFFDAANASAKGRFLTAAVSKRW